jgi:two-component system, chemotaxis family, chemotaxis protein CheY
MKKRILVVEEIDSIRFSVCETLTRKGFATVHAGNLAEALSILCSAGCNIDLVLTEYDIAESTGHELLIKIKADPAMSEVPVVFLTSESDPEKIQMAYKADLACWIKKPFRAESLSKQIQQALERRACVTNNI